MALREAEVALNKWPPDGTHVIHTLAKDGWCWWYRKYAQGETVLEGLEKDAREGRHGL